MLIQTMPCILIQRRLDPGPEQYKKRAWIHIKACPGSGSPNLSGASSVRNDGSGIRDDAPG